MEAAILWIPILAVIAWFVINGHQHALLLICWGAMALGIVFSLGRALLF